MAHVRPDGDAVGSCLGLAWVLRAQGYDVSVVNASPLPHNLYFLSSDLLVQYQTPDWYKEYGCIGVLDCGEIGRLAEINHPAVAALPTFNIDHHVSSTGIGSAIWIEPEASSTAEMVVRLCRQAGWQLTTPAATGLWTGIVTDTGRFCFENTTVSCLEAATECVLAGANPSEIAAHIFQSVTMEERKLQAKLLSRMELYENGRMAVSWLKREDFIEAGFGMEGAQDLINLLRDTVNVEVAIFLYETVADGTGAQTVKISLRTASPHNALAVAAKFNGGGHKRAAGCSISAPMEEARNQVIITAEHAYFRHAEESAILRPEQA